MKHTKWIVGKKGRIQTPFNQHGGCEVIIGESEIGVKEYGYLIAAAPEMLAACKHVINNLKEMSEENFEHEIAHLEYAINKATGDKV